MSHTDVESASSNEPRRIRELGRPAANGVSAAEQASTARESKSSRTTRFRAALLGALGIEPARAFGDRARSLSLSWTRIIILAAVSSVLAGTLTLALLLAHFDAVTRQEASAALRFIESRLANLETEMRVVAESARSDTSWSDCGPALTTLLTRASIASDVVKRFELSERNQPKACRPEGRTSAPLLTYGAGRRLTLSTTGEITARVSAALPTANGRIVLAVLDPQAFEPMYGSRDSWMFDATSHLALMSTAGRALSVLGPDAGAPTTPPALRVEARSKVYGVMVEAQLERSTLIAATKQWVPFAISMTWLVLAVGVLLAWRRALLRTRLYHRIARGLRRREFEPFVQPIMDVRTGKCAGAEVLMRWVHPHRGVVSPAEFIEEAERTDLIIGMSDLVMTRAAHRLAPLVARRPDLYFSFNLTPSQLAMPQLPGRLEEIFTRDTVPPDQVLLELTEREFVDPLALNSIGLLQDRGWRVAIDDFGTGQSSLASLERMSIDRLKIDRAFVSTISEETVSRPVLDSIITLADRLQLPMIAEGVETQAQWDYLAERGVQYAQGYFVGRPMPISAFVEWLSRQENATPSSVLAVNSAAGTEMPIPDIAAQRLWNAMRTPGGLDIRDRMFRLRTYPNCFVGREAVDWIVQHQRVSRAEAVRLGQHLSALGLLSHVVDEHDFQDAELFYRLATPRDASVTLGPSAAGLSASLLGPHGVVLGEHARGLLRHGQCATGKSIVTWIVENRSVSRDDAVRLALQLMREGTLRHVYDDKAFCDDQTLFRVAK